MHWLLRSSLVPVRGGGYKKMKLPREKKGVSMVFKHPNRDAPDCVLRYPDADNTSTPEEPKTNYWLENCSARGPYRNQGQWMKSIPITTASSTYQANHQLIHNIYILHFDWEP
mmetsp:Transcript_11472/g.23328  ORF Transcript_11472/g.23328 Transcript_11472/m.23328 type:complete len:113 (-) Transcript_11472:104-442(-)